MSTETISLTDLRPRISELVERAHREFERFVITRHGRAEAVLMAADELEGLLDTIENLHLLEHFLEPLRSLPFDDAAAAHYGSIRQDLERRGLPIGANDLMIAAIAVAAEATLLTANVGEFSRVIGLRVEAWETAG